MVTKPLFIHQHNGNSACSLCSHDKSLLYVGSLRGSADERAEVVPVIHPDAVIGFVHVVDDVLPVKHYYKILGDEKQCFLLHRLRNPYTAVLGNSHRALHNGYIGAVQVVCLCHGIWITKF